MTLFYALEQAARAIQAAHLERTNIAGAHGLGVRNLEGPLHKATITTKGKDGAFQAVAEALGVALVQEEVSLGALWASLIEGSGEQFEGSDHAQALRLHPVDRPGPRLMMDMTDIAAATIYPMPDRVMSAPPERLRSAVESYFKFYPTAAGWEPTISDGVSWYSDPAAGACIHLQWRLPQPTGSAGERFDFLLTKVATRYDQYGVGVLRPAVGGTNVLHPLLTWWLLLYTLSYLARYKPGAWTRHLDVGTSKDAVRLESLLFGSFDSVSRLVLEALTGEQHLRFDH